MSNIHQSLKIEFDYDIFERTFKNLEGIDHGKLTAFLNSQTTLNQLTQPMSQIFPANTDNILQELQAADIQKFLSSDQPFTHDDLEFIKARCQKTKINAAYVYKCIDEILVKSGEKSLASLLQKYPLQLIENRIIDKWMKHKLAYLRGVIIFTSKLKSDITTKGDFPRIIEAALTDNKLLNALITNLEQSLTVNKTSNGELDAMILNNILMQKELIIMALHNLFTLTDVGREKHQLVFRIVNTLIGSHGFDGNTDKLIKGLGFSIQSLSSSVELFIDRVSFSGIFLFMSFFLSPFQNLLADEAEPDLVYTTFETIEKLKPVLLDLNIEEGYNRIVLVIYEIVTLSLAHIVKNEAQKQTLSNIANEISKQTSEFDPIQDLIVLNQKVKELFPNRNNQYFKWTFRYFLNCIAIIADYDKNETNPYFEDTERINLLFTKILKDVMTNDNIRKLFWSEFENMVFFSNMIKNIFSSYPLYTDVFVKLASSLLIHDMHGQASNLRNYLMNLNSVTIQIDTNLKNCIERLPEPDNSFDWRVKESFNIANFINIQKGVRCLQLLSGEYIFRFEHEFNFFEYIYEQTSNIAFRGANKQISVNDEAIVIFLCRVIITNPLFIYSLQDMVLKKKVGDTEDLTYPFLILLLLIELADKIDFNVEKPKLHVYILEALHALIDSHSSEVTSFVLLLHSVLCSKENSFNSCFDYLINFFLTKQYDMRNIKGAAWYYRGFKAMLGIINGMFCHERSISQCLYQQGFRNRENTNTINQLQTKYDELVDDHANNIINGNLEAAGNYEIALLEFYNKWFCNGFLILPLNYIDLFKNYIIKLCNLFIEERFLCSSAILAEKYGCFKELFVLLSNFVSKLGFDKPLNNVVIRGTDSSGEFDVSIFGEVLDLIPFQEMFAAAFRIVEDIPNSISNEANKTVILSIVNIHVFNYEQNLKKGANPEVVQRFLCSALHCFDTVVGLSTELARTGEENRYPRFYASIKNAFSASEAFCKFKVAINHTQCKVNFVASLFMLITNTIDRNEMEKLKKFMCRSVLGFMDYFTEPPEYFNSYENYHCEAFFDESLIKSTGLVRPLRIKKSFFIRPYVFRALNTLLKYWRNLPGTKVHVLVEYVTKNNFEVPNKEQIFNNFAFEICREVLEKDVDVLNFLIECNNSQPDFIYSLLSALDQKGPKENGLITVIKCIYENLQEKGIKRDRATYSDHFWNERVAKLTLFVFGLLKNPKIRKSHIDVIWSSLFIDVCDLVFQSLESFHNVFEQVFSFTDYFNENYSNFVSLPPTNISVMLHSTYQMADETILIDKTLRQLMEIVLSSLFGLFKNQIDRFTNEFSKAFLSRMFKHYNDIQDTVNPIKRHNGIQDTANPVGLIQLIKLYYTLNSELNKKIMNIGSASVQYWDQDNNTINHANISTTIVRTERVINQSLIKDRAYQNFKPISQKDYNPLLIYLNFLLSGLHEKESFLCAYFASTCNVVRSILLSKSKLQKIFFEFLMFVTSVGVRGVFLGSRSSFIPSSDNIIEFYARENQKLVEKEGNILKFKHESYTEESYSFLPATHQIHGTAKTLLYIERQEMSILVPLIGDNMDPNYNLHDLHLSGNAHSIANRSYETCFEQLFDRIGNLFEIAEIWILASRRETNPNIKLNFVNDLTVFRNVLKSLRVHFKNAVNLVVNYSKMPIQTKQGLQNKGATFEQWVSMILEFFEENYKLTTDKFTLSLFEHFLESYFGYCQSVGLKERLKDVHSFWNWLQNRSETNVASLLPLMEHVLEIQPNLLKTEQISKLSRRFIDKDISDQEYISLMRLFYNNYFVRKEGLSEYTESELLSNIINSTLLESRNDFRSGQFYFEKESSSTHAVFCQILAFATNFIIANRHNSPVQKEAYILYCKLKERIDMILSLNRFNEPGQTHSSILGPNQLNYCFLEELQYVLAFLRALVCNNMNFSSEHPEEFLKIYFTLVSQTMVYISPEHFGHRVGHSKMNAPVKLSDYFKPVSIFEEEIEQIHLKENLGSISGRIGMTPATTETDYRRSINSQNFHFRDQGRYLSTHIGNTSNLFIFKIEIMLIEITFLCADMFRLMNSSGDELILRSSPNFKNNLGKFYVRISGILLDSMNYIRLYFLKLSNIEFYSEGTWHTLLLKNSNRAFQKTHGLFQMYNVYSYAEIKNFVRRAFELCCKSKRMCLAQYEDHHLVMNPEDEEALKQQDAEGIKLVVEFIKLQNYGSNQKQSVQRHRKPEEAPLRSLNTRQQACEQNLSIRQNDVNQNIGVDAREARHYEIHKRAMEEFKVLYTWKNNR